MMDVIVLNPRDILYPWWMQRINKDRHLFNKVIIVITQASTDVDYVGYIRAYTDSIIIESYRDDGSDWRNAAINEALKHSVGDVLFLEQDFLYTDGFIEANTQVTSGFRQGNRFHPAFLFVKGDELYRTDRDFSVDPNVGDHFYKFTKQLENVREIEGDYYHLAGLTQNYRLTENWYNPQVFWQYNYLSQKLPQHEQWRQFCKQVEDRMGAFSEYPEVNLGKYFQ